jgi:hypothetical protein
MSNTLLAGQPMSSNEVHREVTIACEFQVIASSANTYKESASALTSSPSDNTIEDLLNVSSQSFQHQEHLSLSFTL